MDGLDYLQDNKAILHTFECVKSKVERAISDFRENDLDLLELTADERATTHQIACYLKKYFPGWHVDCEYNRKGRVVKRSPIRDDRPIRPDIIIHQRGVKDNLLVIEVKKSNNGIQGDREKLKEFTRQNGEFEYKFGLFMVLSMDAPGFIKLEWYQNGNLAELQGSE
ncbi:MAG: hypothetical protein NTV68_14965 [Methanomicrobiales archaeon]|nr:hypothetical protein [Methanomicrobiales archaeon]